MFYSRDFTYFSVVYLGSFIFTTSELISIYLEKILNRIEQVSVELAYVKWVYYSPWILLPRTCESVWQRLTSFCCVANYFLVEKRFCTIININIMSTV